MTHAATEVKGNSAILHGELNPHGEKGEVAYRFVYSTEGSCTGKANAGIAPVPSNRVMEAKEAPVEVEAKGLEPLSEYTDCLIAENVYAEKIGLPSTFRTPAAAPVVISESAANAEEGSIQFSDCRRS